MPLLVTVFLSLETSMPSLSSPVVSMAPLLVMVLFMKPSMPSAELPEVLIMPLLMTVFPSETSIPSLPLPEVVISPSLVMRFSCLKSMPVENMPLVMMRPPLPLRMVLLLPPLTPSALAPVVVIVPVLVSLLPVELFPSLEFTSPNATAGEFLPGVVVLALEVMVPLLIRVLLLLALLCRNCTAMLSASGPRCRDFSGIIDRKTRDVRSYRYSLPITIMHNATVDLVIDFPAHAWRTVENING